MKPFRAGVSEELVGGFNESQLSTHSRHQRRHEVPGEREWPGELRRSPAMSARIFFVTSAFLT